MSKSFFTGTYAQLSAGSQIFSTAISATPTAFGLTAPQATAYAALNATYVAAQLAVSNPENRSPVKTTDRNNAAIPLRTMARALAKIIDATATVTDGQKQALGLSVRDTRTPVTELGTPNKFKAEIMGNGWLLTKWQCNSPRATGVTYQVYRKVNGETEFTYLGGTGEKKWVDDTLPAGTTQVTYQVQPTRSTAVGNWAQFNISFGTGTGGGATVMSVKEEKSPKIAA